MGGGGRNAAVTAAPLVITGVTTRLLVSGTFADGPCCEIIWSALWRQVVLLRLLTWR